MKEERIKGVREKEYKGVKYRSTLEANTAETLDLMGLPFEYETRKITLLEGFRCPFQKEKVRSITYTPDFILGPVILECKGFETPEWKNKKKYVYKYLMENEPETAFYQIKNTRQDLIRALDNHWTALGYAVRVVSQDRDKKTKRPCVNTLFSSIKEAFDKLNLKGKSEGYIAKALTGKSKWVYRYSWKLVKLKL